MLPTTKLLHQKINIENANASVTPVFQCSAFSSDSPYFYSRKDNPNVAELEQVLATLEECEYAIAVASGMSAIFMVLDLLPQGGHVVINKYIYGCTYKLFQRFCEKRGHTLSVIDLSDKSAVNSVSVKADLVFFETPTNPFLKTVDIAYISSQFKSRNPGTLVVVDNTWATPLYQKPLQFGADVSLYSCTKYFSGHSDVMGGAILLNSTALFDDLVANRFYSGVIMTPFAAWLLRRSMQTLAVRMQQHNNTTQKMLGYLSDFPQIKKIYYPDIDGEQLKNYAGIIFIELREDLVAHYPFLIRRLQLFGTGTGMACVTSMIAQPYTGSHASMSAAEKETMNLGENLIRLCFGMEDPVDLLEDLKAAFKECELMEHPHG